MHPIELEDDFFPTVSIHRDFRRSPKAIINQFQDALTKTGFVASQTNTKLVLSVGRVLYTFVGNEASIELEEYRLARNVNKREIRGIVAVQLDLVFEILHEILRYARDHPKDALESAAAVVVIEDYLEKKLGKAGAAIWKKMMSKPNSRQEIRQLSNLRTARKGGKPSTAQRAHSTVPARRKRKPNSKK